MRTSLAADVRKFQTSDAWALPASDDDEDGHDDDNDDNHDSVGSVIIYIYMAGSGISICLETMPSVR